jgi:hypothetical protein
MNQPSLKVFIITILVGLGLVVCKKPDSDLTQDGLKDSTLSAVVVFSVGDSRISHVDGTEEKAQLGATVKTGDTIITGDKGKVDLQFENGSSIRISPATTLDFAKIAINTNGSSDTQLALVSGKVFANVNKTKKEDNFSVVTPTAIAGVRGTSFIVENDLKTNRARVKVLDGAVAMSPRVPALESLTPEEIESNKDLKKLQDSLQAVEVVIEKYQESVVSANNPKISSDLQSLDLAKAISTVEKEKPVLTATRFTKSEEQELKTIVKVDENVAKELMDLNRKSQSSSESSDLAEVEKKRKAIEEMLANQQEAQKKKFELSLAESPKEFRTKKDIIGYYERIEKIVLNDGRFEVGAIINQENNTMIVHTEQGIKKIDLDSVDEVIYDYQTKTRF